MNKLHPKIEEVLKFPDHGTIIDGVFCSEAIDTSGEMIDLKEMDITSLNDGTGVANTEHINPEDKQFKEAKAEDAGQWAVIVGRIVFAKKIFKEEDCASERELNFWNEVKLPYLYGAIELFDADGHQNAQELAATVWHYHRRGLPVVARFSIEGSTLDRDGHILKPTVARRVAVTIKPCNQAATSSLVERTIVPPKHSKKKEESSESESTSLSKNEKLLGVFETESFPIVDSDKTYSEEELRLEKAFELGGSGAMAPSQRTGAAATTPEFLANREKNRHLKYRLLAAMRDWNKTTPLKEHLSHHLKDVNEAQIDKFSQMAEEIVLGKKELSKKEMEYKGHFVSPGQIQILAGPFTGSILPLLHLDSQHAHVQAFKSGGQQAELVNKLPIATLGKLWAILSKPTATLKPNLPQEVKELNRLPAQSMAIYKLDLSKPIASANTHSEDGAGWFLNGFGKEVYVKPEIDSPHDECKSIDTARREVIFYLVANEFFKLGEFVPPTAIVKNLKTDKFMSAMEKFDGEHFYSRKPAKHAEVKLQKLGNSGYLEKLAVMDFVLGNCDRTHLNYMISKENEALALIDNAFIFNFKDDLIPAYILDYIKKSDAHPNVHVINPSTKDWISQLDVFELKDYLVGLKVSEEIAQQCSARLLSMQTAILTNTEGILDVMMAHKNFLNPAVPNEEHNI